MNSNEARLLDKMYRLYSHIVNDPFLLAAHPKAKCELAKVEQRINEATEHILVSEVYSIKGILKP